MEIANFSMQELLGDGFVGNYIIPKLFVRNNVSCKVKEAVALRIEQFVQCMNDNLHIVMETQYIDRDYRDLYYYHYATKHRSYDRNCIRLSFFDNHVARLLQGEWYTEDNIFKISNAYLGFVVIRPLLQCIGRNVILPKAFLGGADINVCGTFVGSSCMGIKLKAWGFPHSSQDTQLMTCAETTAWAMSEYFCEKYASYAKIMPHKVIDNLQDASYERQVPSQGLTYQMLSLSLKKQGLDSKVYNRKNDGFKELFACYIESGFPLAVAIQNDNIAHAFVAIGRKNIDRNKIRDLEPTEVNGKRLYEWNKCIDEFVVNDDNHAPYRIIPFDNPTKHYTDKKWEGAVVTNFIVPLHQKIYVDAKMAISMSKAIIASAKIPCSEMVLRTFLTTCRNYKEYIIKNSSLSSEGKEAFVTNDFPKFIWITEISSLDNFVEDKVEYVLILDATADNRSGVNPILKFIKLQYPITSFNNNLKSK